MAFFHLKNVWQIIFWRFYQKKIYWKIQWRRLCWAPNMQNVLQNFVLFVNLTHSVGIRPHKSLHKHQTECSHMFAFEGLLEQNTKYNRIITATIFWCFKIIILTNLHLKYPDLLYYAICQKFCWDYRFCHKRLM